jgi:hypothetical protein
MFTTALALALIGAANDDSDINAKTFFALLGHYASSFRDVAFLYEGRLIKPGASESDTGVVYSFQGFYAFRNDGATLLDVFRLGLQDKPTRRELSAILGKRMEILDVSPDFMPRIRDRIPQSGPGGPGSLNGPDAPERIFLAWYFLSLGDPAEYDYEVKGWEDIDGHRCLRAQMLTYGRSSVARGRDDLRTIHIWLDLERGYPLRLERHRGAELESRTEISRLDRIRIPGGPLIWFPVEGKSASFVDMVDRKVVHTREPVLLETHKVLSNTVKFNQGLSDAFFSVKKHALVASDDGLRKLLRELDQKPVAKVKVPPSDPVSRQMRLDEALMEADRQARRLEASSAARAGVGWFEVLRGGLAVFGILILTGVGFWYWRRR